MHHALIAAAGPVIDRGLIADTYACRTGKGTRAAWRRAQQLARRHGWFLLLDIRRYFDRIDHEVLRAQLRRLFKDRRLLALFDRILAAGSPGCPPGKGLPIGNLTSQHLANLYLSALDHRITEVLRVPGYCRYMDDLLLFGDTREALRAAEVHLTCFLAKRLLLETKPSARRLGPVSIGVPFLGLRLWPGLVRLDRVRVRRFRTRLRGLQAARRAGVLAEEDLAARAASLVAWASQADTLALRQSFLQRLDRGTLPADG